MLREEGGGGEKRQRGGGGGGGGGLWRGTLFGCDLPLSGLPGSVPVLTQVNLECHKCCKLLVLVQTFVVTYTNQQHSRHHTCVQIE